MKNSIPNSVKLVDSHLNQFFNEDENIVVFDEIESEVIHRDIFFIKASKAYYLLQLRDPFTGHPATGFLKKACSFPSFI